MVISSNDLRPGTSIELDGDVYTVTDFSHVKMGRGSAYVKVKIKNLMSGSTVEKTFRAGEKLKRAYIERKNMQFLYRNQDEFVFMDPQSYDQFSIDKGILGDDYLYLKDGAFAALMFYNEKAIGMELSSSVELEVVETDPGVKGDTVSGGSKPAKLDTGLSVQVPLFINIGDKLKVDTRSGKYINRV
ncbi:MAG: elongation factor P [bacterium]